MPMHFCKSEKLLVHTTNYFDMKSKESITVVILSQKYAVILMFNVLISSCSILKPAGTANEVPLLHLV